MSHSRAGRPAARRYNVAPDPAEPLPSMPQHTPANTESLTLLSRLAERLPDGLRLLSGVAEDKTDTLYPIEQACVANAVHRRRVEFSTGRWLARQGLLELGAGAAAIPAGTGREPIWPDGIVGSVTHSASRCAVVLGRTAEFVGVGLDLELIGAVDVALADLIVSPSEPVGHRSPTELRLVFSAKESVFKCVFPMLRAFLDFRDIEIRIDSATSTFSAVRSRTGTPRVPPGIGLYESDACGVATLFAVSAREPT
jgi:4'-phosphopantetheinyl transferase EntD